MSVRYVILSDLHLGADTSLLTTLESLEGPIRPRDVSAVLSKLCDCLHNLLSDADRSVQLVLNGDILDLAFSDISVATMVFQGFIAQLMTPRNGRTPFDPRILFVAGNHDHHLWETARQYRFVDTLACQAPNGMLKTMTHTTLPLEEEGIRAVDLESAIRRQPELAHITVNAIYPNLMLFSGSRALFVTHGHFSEAAYSFMSSFAKLLSPDLPYPTNVEDLEADNFAWIDFVWSMLGRSGAIGRELERIYELENAPKEFEHFIGSAITRYLHAKKGQISNATGGQIQSEIEALMRCRLERFTPETLLGDDGVGLRDYLEGPVCAQMQGAGIDVNGLTQASVVFGHTHKPMEMDFACKAFGSESVHLYNSGGWVVDSPEPESLYGGAAILADDDLHVVSLRFFNQPGPDAKADPGVRLAALRPESNPLYKVLSGKLDFQSAPWTEFTQTIRDESDMRYARIRDVLASLK